jgi:hypothetical protein
MQHAPLPPCWPGQQQQHAAHWNGNAQQHPQQHYASFPGSLPPLACMPTLTEREQQLPQLINTGEQVATSLRQPASCAVTLLHCCKVDTVMLSITSGSVAFACVAPCKAACPCYACVMQTAGGS